MAEELRNRRRQLLWGLQRLREQGRLGNASTSPLTFLRNAMVDDNRITKPKKKISGPQRKPLGLLSQTNQSRKQHSMLKITDISHNFLVTQPVDSRREHYVTGWKRSDKDESNSEEEFYGTDSDKENNVFGLKASKRRKEIVASLMPLEKTEVQTTPNKISLSDMSALGHQMFGVSQEDTISSDENSESNYLRDLEASKDAPLQSQRGESETGAATLRDKKSIRNYDMRKRIPMLQAIPNRSFAVRDVVKNNLAFLTQAEQGENRRKLVENSGEDFPGDNDLLCSDLLEDYELLLAREEDNVSRDKDNSDLLDKEDKKITNVLQKMQFQAEPRSVEDEVLEMGLREVFVPYHFMINKKSVRSNPDVKRQLDTLDRFHPSKEDDFPSGNDSNCEKTSRKKVNSQELLTFKLYDLIMDMNNKYKDYSYVHNLQKVQDTEDILTVDNNAKKSASDILTVDKNPKRSASDVLCGFENIEKAFGVLSLKIIPSHILLNFKKVSPTMYYVWLKQLKDEQQKTATCFLIRLNVLQQVLFEAAFHNGAKLFIGPGGYQNLGGIRYYFQWKVFE